MKQKRRELLKSLGLAGGGLGINVPLFGARAVPIAIEKNRKQKDISGVNLTGKILAGGKGIPGVAVTDGINVTLTDSKGNYALSSNGTAEFVYISIPRGYEFTNEKGITRFYKKIASQNGRFKAD